MAKTYRAKIVTQKVTGAFEVTVSADASYQAKQIIEAQYGPIKAWHVPPTEVK